MRSFFLVLMFLAGGLNVLAASRITATPLLNFLSTAHGKSDAKVANELYGLELVERLSSVRLTRLLPALPGNRSREALVVLADISAFLDPPIVLKSDAAQEAPIAVANIVVEYGLVELGGKNYVCPLKGIAYSEDSQLAWLNDVVFENYHLFRSDMRILPGFDEVR